MSNKDKIKKSSVQESKPARPRFIVNPATGQYESTVYVPTVKAKPKIETNLNHIPKKLVYNKWQEPKRG